MSGRRIQTRISRLFSSLLDPALCSGCGHRLKPLHFFCPVCRSSLESVPNPCMLCGLTHQTDEPVCAACLYDPPRWQKMIAPLHYRNLSRDLLIQFKFNESLHLANTLVSGLIEYYRSDPAPQVLIPVPLHRRRLIARGYNQAFEIARILSRQLDIPVDTSALQRIRYTERQMGLSALKRERNIQSAFSYRSIAHYQHVAVVDDIVTTGSTANEITKTLHRAGVAEVEIWCLARVLIRS